MYKLSMNKLFKQLVDKPYKCHVGRPRKIAIVILQIINEQVVQKAIG
jgi:hypothetical protein